MQDNYHERKPTKDFSDVSYMQRTRGELVRKLAETLVEPERTVFYGVNNVVVSLDRAVDAKELPDSTFENVLRFLKGENMGFVGRASFGRFLEAVDQLSSQELRGRIHQLLEEEYSYQVRNVARRYKVLGAEEIGELREGEHPVFTIDMLLLFPGISPGILEKISRRYTLAAKIADDMMDFPDDVRNGFLYIPREHVDKVSGIKLKEGSYQIVGEPELDKSYATQELWLARRNFCEGDAISTNSKLFESAPFRDFRALMYSWIEEAEGVLGIK